MASVSITNLWLNLASDDSAPPLHLRMQTMGIQPSQTISLSPYADGGFRVSSMNDYQHGASVHLIQVQANDRDLLELPPSLGGWLGLTVCIRGLRSRKWWGIWDLPVIDETYRFADMCDVDLTLHSSSWNDVR